MVTCTLCAKSAVASMRHSPGPDGDPEGAMIHLCAGHLLEAKRLATDWDRLREEGKLDAGGHVMSPEAWH